MNSNNISGVYGAMSKTSVTELWAVLDERGRVKWSRGGSSTQPRLMVYPARETAERALRSPWIRQVIPDRSEVTLRRVYKAPGGPQ